MADARDEPNVEWHDKRRWRPSADVVHKNLGGDVVLVHLQTNSIYALNETGARLWELLVEGRNRGEIRQGLLADFEVAEDELELELDALVSSLRAKRLVVDVDE